MIIVADENIDIAIIKRLREDGHDVFSVAETIPASSDEAVLGVFRERRALFLTEDKNFVEMIFHLGECRYGVILVRLDGCSFQDKADIVSKSVFEHGYELDGAIAALTPKSMRIRKVIKGVSDGPGETHSS